MDDALFAIDDVDALYDVAPSEFVARRDELAKRLKAGGEKDHAAAVKKLTKPSVVAWAVNQLARRDKPGIDALLRTSAQVRDAQADALSGGDPSALRTVSRERRELIQSLADAAVAHVGANHRDEAATTLDAASLDDELAVLLRAGRLSKALEPASGFGLAGMPDPPAPRAPRPSENPAPEAETPVAPSSAPAPRPEVKRAADAARRRAEGELEAAQVDLERAERRVRRADEALDSAMQALQAARVARDDALAARDAARSALHKLRDP